MNPEWVSHTITAVGMAVVGVIGGILGTFFWARRNQLKLRGDAAEQERIADANTTKAWKELVDYKSDDFRRKNEEQDKRMAAMVMKMDEMHKAHLDCERASVEREIKFMREANEREIVMRQHEAKIMAMADELAKVREIIASMQRVQDTASERIRTDTVEAAMKLQVVAAVEAEKLKTAVQ